MPRPAPGVISDKSEDWAEVVPGLGLGPPVCTPGRDSPAHLGTSFCKALARSRGLSGSPVLLHAWSPCGLLCQHSCWGGVQGFLLVAASDLIAGMGWDSSNWSRICKWTSSKGWRCFNLALVGTVFPSHDASSAKSSPWKIQNHLHLLESIHNAWKFNFLCMCWHIYFLIFFQSLFQVFSNFLFPSHTPYVP